MSRHVRGTSQPTLIEADRIQDRLNALNVSRLPVVRGAGDGEGELVGLPSVLDAHTRLDRLRAGPKCGGQVWLTCRCNKLAGRIDNGDVDQMSALDESGSFYLNDERRTQRSPAPVRRLGDLEVGA